MSLIKKLGKRFPKLKAKYFEQKKNREYRRRREADPKDYPKLILEEWERHGFPPFDLKHPETYNQKIQWAEIYEPDERKTRCSDKAAVRDWVAETIGSEYLIPSLGVFDTAEELDFDALPDRFVLKITGASKFNIIVKDKKTADFAKIRKQLNKWLKIDYAFYGGFQPHYLGIRPRILAEQYLEDSRGELNDYKFGCFGGEVKYVWVDLDRFEAHRRNVYDPDWNLLPWTVGFPNGGPAERPKNLDKMTELARTLSKGFSHVRVDLYNVDGKIYFGEMTFSSGGGHERFTPPEYDRIVGDEWVIPEA